MFNLLARYRAWQYSRYMRARQNAIFALASRLSECLGQMVVDLEPRLNWAQRRHCYPDNHSLQPNYIAGQMVQEYGPYVAYRITYLDDAQFAKLVQTEIESACQTCAYMLFERNHTC